MVISYHAEEEKSRPQTLHLCCICITYQIHEYIFIVAKKRRSVRQLIIIFKIYNLRLQTFKKFLYR